MSSGAVAKALREDLTIQSYVGANGVYPDYAADTPPRDGFFIILRWGIQNYRREVRNGPTMLTVWAHQPKEFGSDTTNLNKLLDRCQEVLEEMEHVVGEDDIRVTNAIFTGKGGVLYDPGFETYARSSGYNVLLHVV